MAATTYTDTVTLLTADTMNQVDQLVYETFGTGKTTIASATTPDIFAATGNLIDYTGTATCTGFVAAPSVGAKRTLICAGVCLFTAGANLLIEGITSGTTITLAANAIVNVIAITTTQFKITYSVTGTFTATGTGFTANPTVTANYKVENGVVNVYIPQLTGTSNNANFTITGFPPQCGTGASGNVVSDQSLGLFNGEDNTAFTSISIYVTNGVALVLGKIGGEAAGFTTSGTKYIRGICINYKLI